MEMYRYLLILKKRENKSHLTMVANNVEAIDTSLMLFCAPV